MRPEVSQGEMFHVTRNSKTLEKDSCILEFQVEISFFKCHKDYLLVSLVNHIVYFYKNYKVIFWTICGDVILDAVFFKNCRFLILSSDLFIRFYSKDLIIGEMELSTDVSGRNLKDISLCSMSEEDDWTFILKSRTSIRKYRKNTQIWEFKAESIVNLVKYLRKLNGIFLLLGNTRILFIDSRTGKCVKDFQHLNSDQEILDLEFSFLNGKIQLLLPDKQVLEIPFEPDQTLEISHNVQGEYNLLKQENTPQERFTLQEHTLVKEITQKRESTRSDQVISLDLSLDSEFTVKLRVFSLEKGVKLKKILVESQELLKESLFFTSKGVIDQRLDLADLEKFKEGVLHVTVGCDSGKIHSTWKRVKRFNTCLYDPGLKLPGLEITCNIGDFDIYSWIKRNFLSLPKQNFSNGDNTVLGWKFKDQSTFVLEVLSRKIKIYGSNSSEFISVFLGQLSRDYPLLQIKDTKVEFIDLVIRGKNALECKQWEDFLLISSQIYKECKKML